MLRRVQRCVRHAGRVAARSQARASRRIKRLCRQRDRMNFHVTDRTCPRLKSASWPETNRPRPHREENRNRRVCNRTGTEKTPTRFALDRDRGTAADRRPRVLRAGEPGAGRAWVRPVRRRCVPKVLRAGDGTSGRVALRVHYNTVRPHSSLGFLSPEQFRMAGKTDCGNAGRSAALENSSSFPLSHSHNGVDSSPNSSLSTWT